MRIISWSSWLGRQELDCGLDSASAGAVDRALRSDTSSRMSTLSISPIKALGRAVLLVDDADAAVAFYDRALGFRVLHDQTTDGNRRVHIGVPGQDGVGIWLIPVASEDDRALVGRQSGGYPCSSSTQKTCKPSLIGCAAFKCEPGTSGTTQRAALYTWPTCTATSLSSPNCASPESDLRIGAGQIDCTVSARKAAHVGVHRLSCRIARKVGGGGWAGEADTRSA